MSIAEQKISHINKYTVPFLSGNLKSPDHRLCKRIFHRLLLFIVISNSPVRIVGLNHQNLRAATFEIDDTIIAQLVAIQANIIGTNAGRQRIHIQKFRIKLVDLQPYLATAVIPVIGKISLLLLHTLGFFGDGWDILGKSNRT